MKVLDAVLSHFFSPLPFGNYFPFLRTSVTCHYSVILGRSLVFLECWGNIPWDLAE